MAGLSQPDMPAVVIPVFNAPEDLERCLESVHQYTRGAEVLIVDDASDHPGVQPVIQKWLELSANYRLLINQQNQGFVASVNLGMNEYSGDVVLLNSDTVVTPGWLGKLSECLQSSPDIATATPWTNNGEIASYPQFCQVNEPPVNADELAIAAALADASEYPDIPTAVGFCMAISRRALDELGTFDADRFGRGYGEENDFSFRARAAGWRNVLCHTAYVVHRGGASFGPLGLKPDEGSMHRLLEAHPDYLETVSEWIKRDPLSEYRQALQHAIESSGSNRNTRFD